MNKMKKPIRKRCNFVFIPMSILLCAFVFCLFFCINGYTKTLHFYTENYRNTANFCTSFSKYEISMHDFFKYGGDYYLTNAQSSYEASKEDFKVVYSGRLENSLDIKSIIDDMNDVYDDIDEYMVEISTNGIDSSLIQNSVLKSIDSMNVDISNVLEKQGTKANAAYDKRRTEVIICEVVMIVSAVAFGCIFSYFIYFMKKRITEPIEDIAGWAHLFDEGYSEMDELKYDVDDEIGKLVDSFNIVRDKLIIANALKKEYEVATRKLKDEEEHKKKFVQQLYVEKAEKDAISSEAKHDGLTGLYNRRSFDSIVSDFIARRPGGNEGMLFLIDMDNFKLVNDTLGHLGGDEALKTLAGVLRLVFPGAYIGRYGGDEFIVFKTGYKNENEGAELASDLCAKMDRAIEYEGKSTKISVSVGVANSIGVTDGSELYMRADKALYYAKDHGRNRYALNSQL